MKRSGIMKQIGRMLLLCALLLLPAQILYADSTLTCRAGVSPGTAAAGETVTLTVSLDHYTEETGKIRGIQIDVTGFAPEILEPLSYVSLIEDTSAMSNTGSYNADRQYVRLLYFNTSGTIPIPETGTMDVFQVEWKLKETLTGTGTIRLPVTAKVVTENGNRTLQTEAVISYGEAAPVYEVEITWGDLSYTYSEGTWNPETHTYEGAGWSADPAGGDHITVVNNGGTDVTAAFAYETDRSDITGTFSPEQVSVPAGESQAAAFALSGAPSEALENVVIGQVTVTLE